MDGYSYYFLDYPKKVFFIELFLLEMVCYVPKVKKLNPAEEFFKITVGHIGVQKNAILCRTWWLWQPDSVVTAAGLGGYSSRTRWLQQPDSVVTFPAQPAKRKGVSLQQGAGWMRGEADRERANSAPTWRTRGSGWPRLGYGPRRGWIGRTHRGRQRRPW